MQYLGDSIAMEGTNAKVTLPDRQHSPATSSPGATFTPSFPSNFAACAEPTPDNQYTTFKPTHELVHAAMRNHILL